MELYIEPTFLTADFSAADLARHNLITYMNSSENRMRSRAVPINPAVVT